MDSLSTNADFNLYCLIEDFVVLALVLVSGDHFVVFSHFVDTADIVAVGIHDIADTVEIAVFD